MDDLARLRIEYEDRERRFAGTNVYSWTNLANLFAIQGRQRAILYVLQKKGFKDLPSLAIFELGCGGGGVLAEFLSFGASPRNLYGIDLLFDRLLHAHTQLPASRLINADGRSIPFSYNSFDIVLQFTALSSILDPVIRQKLAQDMMRVLKPNGIILWYDFWLNPTNPQTHGIRPAEIRELFSNCTYEFHKITLAPPLARRIVPISWGLALFLESLKIFNSHYLALIRPKKDTNL
jgi:ubiquinone/menaquinone biosynthesis C-methylase UbiE